MKKLVFTSVLFSFVFLLTPVSFATEADVIALVNQYTTYGGTNEVVGDAFTRLTMIMSNPTFIWGYGCAMILAFALGGLFTGFRQLVKGDAGLGPWLTWFGTIIFGLMIMVSFFQGGDTLYVTDATTNDTTTVNNVPKGILVTAGMFNSVETWLIGLVDVAGLNGERYRDGAGGIGLTIISNFMKGNADNTTLPAGLSTSLNKYCLDCVFYEMNRPGNALPESMLINPPNNLLLNVLGLAASPAVFTTYYGNNAGGTPVNPEGVTASCDAAWNGGVTPSGVNIMGIRPSIAALATAAYYDQACADAGFEPASAAAMTRCRAIFHSTLDRLLAGAGAVNNNTDLTLFTNKTISEALVDSMAYAGESTTLRAFANKDIMTNMQGASLMANSYVPILRATILTIILGVMPFVCFLIPTPLIGRALSFIFGSFFFICCWGVCDALVHAIAFDYAVKVFREVTVDQLGMTNILLMPSICDKALAMFGSMRFSSMVLAGIMTTMLFKFGAPLASSVAGSISGSISNASSAAAQTAMDPVKSAHAFEGYMNAPSLSASMSTMYGNYGPSAYTQQRSDMLTQQTITGLSAAQQNLSNIGSNNMEVGQNLGFSQNMSNQQHYQNARAIESSAAAAGFTSPSAYLADKARKEHMISANELAYINENYQGGVGQFGHDNGLVIGATGAGKTGAEIRFGTDSVRFGADQSVESNMTRTILPTIGQQILHGEFKDGMPTGPAGDIFRTLGSTEQGRAAFSQMGLHGLSAPHMYVHDRAEALRVLDFAKAHGMKGLPKDQESRNRIADRMTKGEVAMRMGMNGQGEIHVAGITSNKGWEIGEREIESLNAGERFHVGDVDRRGDDTHIGDVFRKGDDSHVGDVERRGDDTHVGNVFRQGDNIHVGNVTRRGDTENIGDESIVGNRKTVGSYGMYDAVMNANHDVLDRAYSDKTWALTSAKALASELQGRWAGEIANMDSMTLEKHFSASGGIKVPIIGGATVGGSAQDTDQSTSRGAADWIVNTVYRINTDRSMSSADKDAALRKMVGIVESMANDMGGLSTNLHVNGSATDAADRANVGQGLTPDPQTVQQLKTHQADLDAQDADLKKGQMHGK